ARTASAARATMPGSSPCSRPSFSQPVSPHPPASRGSMPPDQTERTRPMTDATTDIRAFIAESFLFGDADALPADTDSLIEHGIVDSTGVLELVAFIEERFGIAVADAEI